MVKWAGVNIDLWWNCLFSYSSQGLITHNWHLQLVDYLTNVSQLTNCKGVKMKPAIILLGFVLSSVHCNQNEFHKLRKWLSTPNFNFSHVPTEEQSLCQKHLELYTNSLSLNHGLPKSWAMKSKAIIYVHFKKAFLL